MNLDKQRKLTLVNHSQLDDASRSWEDSWKIRTGFKIFSRGI